MSAHVIELELTGPSSQGSPGHILHHYRGKSISVARIWTDLFAFNPMPRTICGLAAQSVSRRSPLIKQSNSVFWRGIHRMLPSMVYARGKVKIQYVLVTRTTKATATTATRGPRISKRWLSAVSSSTVARKTVTLTYLSPMSRVLTPFS